MKNQDLWLKYKNTNKIEYKQKLIEEYVYLVKIIAGRLYNYYGGNVEFDDLIGYGVFGLIDAIEKFDINRDLKFETYSQIRIRGSIIDNLRKVDWIPRSLRKKAKRIEEATKLLENRLGREINTRDLSEELNLSVESIQNILSEISSFNIISLDEILSYSNEYNINENTNNTPEKIYEKKETEEILERVIDFLPQKEKLVISLYYYEQLTYKEIGQILNLSESRIAQIHSKTIIKIKKELDKIGIINGGV